MPKNVYSAPTDTVAQTPTEHAEIDALVHDFDEDLVDLEERASRDYIRSLLTGLPARPGTLR